MTDPTIPTKQLSEKDTIIILSKRATGGQLPKVKSP